MNFSDRVSALSFHMVSLAAVVYRLQQFAAARGELARRYGAIGVKTGESST
jgi:hypothetical protein